ncbi:hypothetical protein [Vibrio mediterranei]|uniref:hypothetical protein n=1 Tax=Vibrio mediterranei TaxID=689 RepID=UPI00406766FA
MQWMLEKSIWFWVRIVLVAVLIYFTVLVTPRYEAEARIVVKQSESISGHADMSFFNMMGVDQLRKDALLVRDYLHSADYLKLAAQSLELKAHFLEHERFVSLKPVYTTQRILERYRKLISIEYDDYAGVLVLKTQAYTQEKALELVTHQVKESEAFINRIGHQLALADIQFAEAEVERMKMSLDSAQVELREFQTQHDIFDPGTEIAAKQSSKASIEARLLELQSRRAVKATLYNESTFELKAIDEEVAVLERQRSQLVHDIASGVSDALSDLSFTHQSLYVKAELAYAGYKAAMVAYERARIESYRKLKYMVKVQSPLGSELTAYPNMWKSMFTALMVVLASAFCFAFLKATLKEGVEQ